MPPGRRCDTGRSITLILGPPLKKKKGKETGEWQVVLPVFEKCPLFVPPFQEVALMREEGLESQTAEGAFDFCTELCSVGSTGLAPSSSYSDTCRAASREVAPTIATLLGFTPERLPMGFTVPGGTVVTLSYHTNARGTRWSPFLTRHGGCHPPSSTFASAYTSPNAGATLVPFGSPGFQDSCLCLSGSGLCEGVQLMPAVGDVLCRKRCGIVGGCW